MTFSFFYKSALTIIEEEIAKESEVGKLMQTLLSSGEAIPEEVVAKCFEAKVQSPEVAHHGLQLSSNILNYYLILINKF